MKRPVVTIQQMLPLQTQYSMQLTANCFLACTYDGDQSPTNNGDLPCADDGRTYRDLPDHGNFAERCNVNLYVSKSNTLDKF